MNREEILKQILKQCCGETCTWNNQKACHKVELYYTVLSLNDLKFLSTIKVHTLELHWNYIEDNGAKYLADNKTIRSLSLCDNNIGNNGAKYFTEAIIPDLQLGNKYSDIAKISNQNYVKYIQDIQGVILQYIIKDITCIIIDYIKND